MNQPKNKTITVYCASADRLPEIYFEAAAALGREIAHAGYTLVTGAGYTGLMGAVADAAMAAGGKVIGIIPRFMVERGWNHKGLSELRIVESMHERKAMMAESACGVIALPGGIGTFEELLEIITWRQLGLFKGNIVIYNVDNYYGPLISMLQKAIEQGFMQPDHRALFTVAETASEALAAAGASAAEQKFSPKF